MVVVVWACLSLAAIGAQPNLIPYQPSGWSGPIVASKVLGATSDSALITAGDTLFVSWAVLNNSTTPISTTFTVSVYVDGGLVGSWVPGSLGANTYTAVQDYAVGYLTAGSHTISVVADSGGVIAESNESDNSYTKNITVSSIRIEPTSLTFSGGPPTLGGNEAQAKAGLDLPGAGLAPLPIFTAPPDKLIDSLQLQEAFSQSATVKVIVNLNPPLDVLAQTDFRSASSLRRLRPILRRLQQDILDVLPQNHVIPRFRFENMAGFSAEVTLEGLQALQSDPRVHSIEPVYSMQPHLAQGIPLIGGMTFRSTFPGTGTSIAICDTGIDYRHSRLGGGGFPNSKVIGGRDFGDNDSDPLATVQGHGTSCAGIAAGGLGTVGDYIGGVAYDAKLYALKISVGTTTAANSDALEAAWDWCVTHQNDDPANPIRVISTSYGGGRYFQSCDTDTPSMTTVANNAMAAGITVCVSSGNDGWCDSIAWPACISGVVSVGGVYDAAFGHFTPCVDSGSCAPKTATGGCSTGWYSDDVSATDKVTSYSNTYSYLEVLAPANQCYTLDIVGGNGYSSNDYFDSFGGTSASCPYAAGAVASLQSAAKVFLGSYLSVPSVRNRLRLYGDNITDTKVAIAKPRINLARAIQSLTNTTQLVRIFNDGNSSLTVNSITPETASPWLSTAPSTPLSIAAGSYQDVTLTADLIAAPIGQYTVRLLVNSTDSAFSPYPEGINVVVNNVNYAPTISDISDQTTTPNTATSAIGFTIGDTETAASSLTVSASSSNTSLVPNGNISLGGSAGSRTITITPAANQIGSCTITVAVSDGWKTATDTFVLTVNSPPNISDIADQLTARNVATPAIGFTVGDAETPVGSLTLTKSSSNTTLVPNANIVFGGSGASRTVTVTPAANQSGTTTITVTVSDGVSTASDTFVLTVNAAPTISDIANQLINANSATAALGFTVGDVETAAGSLTLTKSSSNTTLVPDDNIVFGGSGASRTVTVTPAADQSGTSTITVTVSDGTSTASDTFVLTVNAFPTISDIPDQFTPRNVGTAAIAFTVGDVETAAGSLTLTKSSSNTTLVPNANIVFGGSGASRTVTVTPAANQSGTATITVTVSDGVGTASDTFVLTVNAAPTISDIANQLINANSATAAIAFTVGDVETAAGSLILTKSSSNTTLVPDANIVFGGSGASRTVTVTPAADQSGTSTITVTVSDGTSTASDTFVLTVNAFPTISDIPDQFTPRNVATAAIGFTVGDVETAAGSLTLTKSSSNTTLVPNANIVFGGSGASRTVTVTPAANRSGTATITVTVNDGAATASDTFVLTVNALPTISNIADQSINANSATAAIAFTVGDVETAAGSLTLTKSSSNTTLVPDANIVFGGSGASRTVTVTPAADQSGTSTITVTVSDGTSTASDTFVLTVNAFPTISDIPDQFTPRNVATAAIAFTVGDVETAAGSLTLTKSSSNTTLVPNANIVFGGSGASRTVTVTPAANRSGTATITVTVNDGAATASDTFVLTVNALPTISDIPNQLINANSATAALGFTVGDIETAAGSLTLTKSSSNPTLVPDASIVFGGSGASRTVTVTPAPDQSGSADITVTVSDGISSSSDMFTVTVNAIPTITSIPDQQILANSSSAPISFAVHDDETPESLTESGSSSDPSLIPNGNIVIDANGSSPTVTVSPVGNKSGSATITVTVSDGAASASRDFQVTVNAAVVGRYVFYNQSSFDGDAGPSSADDLAIASDKAALLPGNLATFANTTSFSRGINGIMIDIAGLAGTPQAADFEFRVGNENNLANWTTATAPSSITVRPGAGVGGSDRVTLIWNSGVIKKQWLEVRVLPTAATGLAAADVFYFGNAVGDTGDGVSDSNVLVNDALRILNHLEVGVAKTNIYDIDRDGSVLVNDALICLNNLAAGPTALIRLDLR